MLGLGPVRIPEYLRRPQMVTRVGPNQVAFAQYDRWAQPLDASFVRVLGENLSGLLGGADTATHPWFSTITLNFTVEVDVERFERDESGSVQLSCVWVVRDGESGDRIDGARFDKVVPAESNVTWTSVVAQSRLLGDLGLDIARAIRSAAGDQKDR